MRLRGRTNVRLRSRANARLKRSSNSCPCGNNRHLHGAPGTTYASTPDHHIPVRGRDVLPARCYEGGDTIPVSEKNDCFPCKIKSMDNLSRTPQPVCSVRSFLRSLWVRWMPWGILLSLLSCRTSKEIDRDTDADRYDNHDDHPTVEVGHRLFFHRDLEGGGITISSCVLDYQDHFVHS